MTSRVAADLPHSSTVSRERKLVRSLMYTRCRNPYRHLPVKEVHMRAVDGLRARLWGGPVVAGRAAINRRHSGGGSGQMVGYTEAGPKRAFGK
jgi:hypothetical protein